MMRNEAKRSAKMCNKKSHQPSGNLQTSRTCVFLRDEKGNRSAIPHKPSTIGKKGTIPTRAEKMSNNGGHA
eukprot:scaffold17872_cov36-Cyclotella_meneghiniana.AAC.4